jgi:hypothetical protein
MSKGWGRGVALARPAPIIAVIRGASRAEVQHVFRTLVERWRTSLRLAGVIAEDHDLPGRACSAGYLRNVATAERFSIFADLGPGAAACHLDGAGVLSAAQSVRRDIAAGCDLVLLSKFGKLEAAGEGLAGAFTAAIEARVPLVTSVSPVLEEAWTRTAGPSFVILPADPIAIDAWRCAIGAPAGAISRAAS